MNKTMLLFLLILLSCKKKDSFKTEKRVGERIAEYITEKNELNTNRYSSEVFLHIYSEMINDFNYKTYVSINGLKSNSADFQNERMIINNFPTVVYYSLSDKRSLPTVFFVPEAKSWTFLSEFSHNEIYLNELKPIFESNKGKTEINDETDF